LVTVVVALLASDVAFQNAIEVWFVEDDPALANYRVGDVPGESGCKINLVAHFNLT
jgi:hypothetical protein